MGERATIGTENGPGAGPRVSFRERWLSRRALLLHLTVLVVAPGCAVAGWWQATRALAGNGLSWAYSVEWPIFALLALAGWWHLVHEDPEERAERRADRPVEAAVAAEPGAARSLEPAVARMARALMALVAVDLVLGFVSVFAVPFGRPSGFVPARGAAVYVLHASFGIATVAAAGLLLVRARTSQRVGRVVGWLGFVGVAVAGGGGLLTAARSFPRFVGMAFMLIGTVAAVCAYAIPATSRSPRRPPAA